MVFYKGAVSYEAFKDMPIPELLDLNDLARRVDKQR